jgi:hypothetical protein
MLDTGSDRATMSAARGSKRSPRVTSLGTLRRVAEIGQGLLAVAASAVVLATPALAWNEPDSFRGVPWGATQEVARDLLSKREGIVCSDNGGCFTQDGKVGPVSVGIAYEFGEGKLEAAILSFAPRDYDALLAIFRERYGAPTEVRNESAITMSDGSVVYTNVNPIATWTGRRVDIVLRRYGLRPERGEATITLKMAVERRRREQEKVIKKAGEDDL